MARRDPVAEAQAHALNQNRRDVGDPTHDVDVMHATIENRRGALHQGEMLAPDCTVRRLVQPQPKDIGAGHGPRLGDQALPAGMILQDMTDQQLAPGLTGRCHHLARIIQRQSDRLFDKNMRLGGKCGPCIIRMAIAVGVDRHQIRRQISQLRAILRPMRQIRIFRRRTASGNNSASVDDIRWTWSSEPSVLAMALQTGDADVINPAPAASADVINSNPQRHLSASDGSAVF